MSQLPISLERPVGEEDDSQFGDFVEDITAESPYRRRRSTCGARTSIACCARYPSATGGCSSCATA